MTSTGLPLKRRDACLGSHAVERRAILRITCVHEAVCIRLERRVPERREPFYGNCRHGVTHGSMSSLPSYKAGFNLHNAVNNFILRLMWMVQKQPHRGGTAWKLGTDICSRGHGAQAQLCHDQGRTLGRRRQVLRVEFLEILDGFEADFQLPGARRSRGVEHRLPGRKKRIAIHFACPRPTMLNVNTRLRRPEAPQRALEWRLRGRHGKDIRETARGVDRSGYAGWGTRRLRMRVVRQLDGLPRLVTRRYRSCRPRPKPGQCCARR